jgi:hypothetical protein
MPPYLNHRPLFLRRINRMQVVVAVRPGCLELRLQARGGEDARAGCASRDLSWPASIHILYGWRWLIMEVPQRAVLSTGVAEYEVTNATLGAMGLLQRAIYARATVAVRVDFGNGYGLDSEVLSIDGCRTEDEDTSAPRAGGGSSLSNRRTSLTSHGSVLEPPPEPGGETWGQSMARAWVQAKSEQGPSPPPSEVEDDEGWDDRPDGSSCRLCAISCCMPCYSGCQCAYHVVRSTPTTAILALGSIITVACVMQYYMPLVKHELRDAGVVIEDQLVKFVRAAVFALLFLDSIFFALSALLTGTTKRLFCTSIETVRTN